MADEVKVETKLTIEQIQEQMADATGKRDWKQLSKLANMLVKAEAEQKAAEVKAKQEALAQITGSVGDLFNGLVKFLVGGQSPDATEVDEYCDKILALSGTELDKADGVWYSNDFSAESGHATSIRLMKGQAKEAKPKAEGQAKTSGGGGGKKFDVKTEDMITEVGESAVLGDGQNGTIKAGSAYVGKTVKEAWDASTDKNWRYGLRTILLKHTGRQ